MKNSLLTLLFALTVISNPVKAETKKSLSYWEALKYEANVWNEEFGVSEKFTSISCKAIADQYVCADHGYHTAYGYIRSWVEARARKSCESQHPSRICTTYCSTN